MNCGFAKEIPKNFGYIVENIKSDNDPVPTITHAGPYIGFAGNFVNNLIKRNKYSTTSLPQNEGFPFSGHTFANPTYQESIRANMRELFRKHGVNHEN